MQLELYQHNYTVKLLHILPTNDSKMAKIVFLKLILIVLT